MPPNRSSIQITGHLEQHYFICTIRPALYYTNETSNCFEISAIVLHRMSDVREATTTSELGFPCAHRFTHIGVDKLLDRDPQGFRIGCRGPCGSVLQAEFSAPGKDALAIVFE